MWYHPAYLGSRKNRDNLNLPDRIQNIFQTIAFLIHVSASRVIPMYLRLMPLALCFLFLGGCVGTTASLLITTTGPTGTPEEIPATLMKPEGPGPFPAVVIMHDCSGLGPRSSGAPSRWARELFRRGYFIVIPDSFTTRGHAAGVCTDPSPSRAEVSPFRRVRDAYAALAYVRTLPYVDGSRVGLMGGSHGGTTTLASMVAPENNS